MALSFFDCDCSVGRLAVPQPGSVFSVAALLAEMDYAGIDQALVYHSWAREYSVPEGNRKLMEEIADQDRLVPAWVVLPHHTREMPSPDILIDEMRRLGVRAVRAFPARGLYNHYWSLSEWSAGPLLRALAAQHVPFFVGFDQITWDIVYSLGTTYPELRIIITGVRYEELRHLYPLFDQLPNLYVGISRLVVHYGLEATVERFGARRFLFGTEMPTFGPGPALCHVNYAEIDGESKALIAGDNLRHLVQW